jgi:Cytochrome P450
MRAGGISKTDLGSLKKMDSFLKESARFNHTNLRKWIVKYTVDIYINSIVVGVIRTAQKGFRFRDGTVIPPGAAVAAPAYALHYDAKVYPNPETFDGFRFSNQSEASASTLKRQVVRTAADYLPFGHGRHAW